MNNQLSLFYYDSAARRIPFIDEVKDIFRYRDLLRMLIITSIKTRYKRSSLGVVWTLLNPLLYTVVMTMAFSHLFHYSVQNYPVYLLTGLVCWTFFTQTTTQAMNSLVWGGDLLKKVYIPRTIFALAAVGNGLINLSLACVPLVLIMLVFHQPIHISVWFAPVAIFMLAVFTLGISLILSTIAVYFTDIIDMFQVVLQACFYLTPIMYPETILPPKYIHLLRLNPVYDLIKPFRDVVYLGTFPNTKLLIAAGVSSIFTLCLGWWIFTRKADEISHRI